MTMRDRWGERWPEEWADLTWVQLQAEDGRLKPGECPQCLCRKRHEWWCERSGGAWPMTYPPGWRRSPTETEPLAAPAPRRRRSGSSGGLLVDVTGGGGYSKRLWREYFSNITDDEIRALDMLGAGPYDDHNARQMLAAYRLGRAHERQASAPST